MRATSKHLQIQGRPRKAFSFCKCVETSYLYLIVSVGNVSKPKWEYSLHTLAAIGRQISVENIK